jgi:cyclic di-GMP phosphodiesterase
MQELDPQHTEQSMTERTQNGSKNERILLVDDEVAVRNIVASMLVAAGYECSETGSGLEALALLESGEQFHLVLADLLLPGLDGMAMLERIKETFPYTSVVIVTGVHDISVALAVIRSGAYDYLLEPFDGGQLLAVVRRALDDRSAQLEHRAYVSNLEQQVATLTEQLKRRK